MGKRYTPLNIEERTMIQTGLGMGLKPAAMARSPDRSAATLARELRRNGWVRPPGRRNRGRAPVAGGYRAEAAHRRARTGTVTPHVARRLRPGTALWDPVLRDLQAGYAPEEIAGTRAVVYPDTPELWVSHETVYTAIDAMPRGELRTEGIGGLCFGHAKRRPRARGQDRRGRIPDRVSIQDPPPEGTERSGAGPFEGDLIQGASNRSAVGTRVERTPWFTVRSRMEDARAEAARKGLSHVFNQIESPKRLSLTDDLGRERAEHRGLTQATGVKVYCADPHSPWQRGINENTHGLLRQVLPQGRDLSGFTQEALDAIAWKLNTRPRKSLGFKCPAEWFTPDAFDFRPQHAALFARGL